MKNECLHKRLFFEELCPHGAAVLRVKGVLVHRGHGSVADVCFPRVNSEWYMKAMRARTNVVVFLGILLLTSIVLALVYHATVGPWGYERHAVLGHTLHTCLVLEVPIALIRRQTRVVVRHCDASVQDVPHRATMYE